MDIQSAGFVDGVLWVQLSIPKSGLGRGAISFEKQDMLWAYNPGMHRVLTNRV
jgi:hypothetical protein